MSSRLKRIERAKGADRRILHKVLRVVRVAGHRQGGLVGRAENRRQVGFECLRGGQSATPLRQANGGRVRILLARLGLQPGRLFGVADVQGVVRLLRGLEWTYALMAVPVPLRMDRIRKAGLPLAPRDVRL